METNGMEMGNAVLEVARLTQEIADLDKASGADKAELSECLLQRGKLLLSMGDKQGAQADMQRYLSLNPEKLAQLCGDFQAEGREGCH